MSVVQELSEIDYVKVSQMADRYGGGPESLISVLQDVQLEYNYLPRAVMERVCERLGVPVSRAYGIATFYTAFSLEPKGLHVIKVCTGTTCHVKGAPRLIEAIAREYAIVPGETSNDGLFTLETVNCLGACALAPVVVVDDVYYEKQTPERMLKELRALARKRKPRKKVAKA